MLLTPSNKNPFFWQPKTDYLKKVLTHEYGNMLMVLFNYSIWYYLLFVYFLIVSKSINAFWQVLIATIIGEFIEKFGKEHKLWRRPLYKRRDDPPPGLVERWYKTGSFPSGHTIKSAFFFLFCLQYRAINPFIYLFITFPLILFRVLVGFHYPIDIIGGAFIGGLLWYLVHLLTAPTILNNFISFIFNYVFRL